MSDYGLSDNHLRILKNAFAFYLRAGEVILFGSRAMGTHTQRSDIDLVVKGARPHSDIALVKINDILGESDLPWLCDIVYLGDIKNPSLQEHIKRVGRPLFDIAKLGKIEPVEVNEL